MCAVPVDLSARLAAAEGVVAAPGAGRQLLLDLALGHVEEHPVADRTPGPWVQGRGEPVQHFAQLLVWHLMVSHPALDPNTAKWESITDARSTHHATTS